MTRADIAMQIKQGRAFRSPAQKAFVSLIKTNDMLEGAQEATFRAHGVTPTQYNVLRILRGSHPDGLPVMEVGSRMLSRVPDVTRLLDRMEKHGFIERHRGKVDRRSVIVRLTAKGLDLVNRLDPVVEQLEERLFAGLTEEQTEQLCVMLESLREKALEVASEPPVIPRPDGSDDQSSSGQATQQAG